MFQDSKTESFTGVELLRELIYWFCIFLLLRVVRCNALLYGQHF